MVLNTLLSPGINDLVHFSYIPVNHYAPNGSYICEEDGQSLDCKGQQFDACLTYTACWWDADDHFDPYTVCRPEDQLKLAKYLQCFEGPFANHEVLTNSSMRKSCMDVAGLNYTLTESCLNGGGLAVAEESLNISRTVMEMSHPEGYFPHIYISDRSLANFSWTALTRELCEYPDIVAQKPSACAPADLALQVRFGVGANLSVADASGTHGASLSGALHEALDYAVSNCTLPLGSFATDDDTLPLGAPSYANVRSVLNISGLRAEMSEGASDDRERLSSLSSHHHHHHHHHYTKESSLEVYAELAVLGAFAETARSCAAASGEFKSYLSAALAAHGFKGIAAADIVSAEVRNATTRAL